MSDSPAEFLRTLEEGVRRWGGAEWIAGRTDGDDVVVLYRQRLRDRDEPEDLVEGARLNLADLGRTVFGISSATVDDVLVEAILEIVEPHPLGVTLDVPWADSLTPNPRHVCWYGDAITYARTGPGT